MLYIDSVRVRTVSTYRVNAPHTAVDVQHIWYIHINDDLPLTCRASLRSLFE